MNGMSEEIITEMSYEEFKSLIDSYIDRSSQEDDEMSTSTFFELL